FGVAHRRDHLPGLVQRHGQGGLVQLQAPAVDMDHLAGGIDPQALLTDDLPVDQHSPRGDQRLAGAPRAEAGPGQHPLQPLPLRAVQVTRPAAILPGAAERPSLPVAQRHVAGRGEGAAASAGALAGRHQAAAPRAISSRASRRYALRPFVEEAKEMIGSAATEASGNLTVRLMVVWKTLSGKASTTRWQTSRAWSVRGSNIVIRMPSISRRGLIRSWTF